jgi:urease accessory protein
MTESGRTMSLRNFRCLPLVIAGLALPQAAFAHEQVGVGGGLVSGFLHPLTGIDHLIAMVAVGIWGAQLGAPAIWVLPITFPLVMAIGGVLGILHVPLPMPEVMIALSALILGAAVAVRVRLPFAAAAAVVAVFAIFHGYAHGAELPKSADPLAYGVGFVVSTGLLHLCGITIGTLTRWPAGERLIQGLGVVIALLGGYFLALSLGAVA